MNDSGDDWAQQAIRRPGSETRELQAKAQILIVDDDPIAIRVVRRALHEYACVRFATSGADAFCRIGERTPDLILLDAEMPGEHGFEVCRRFKQEPALRDVPIIFVTALDDPEFEVQALRVGAADFIGKPISPALLKLRAGLHLRLKWQLDQLQRIARTDELTQLWNRRAFNETVRVEWKRSLRAGNPLSLIIADVDNFKRYNDTYGHADGDECLRTVATCFQAVARRPGDFVARYGGEEFAVVLPDTDPQGALHLAKRICERVQAAGVPHESSDVAGVVTVSAGATTLHPGRLGRGGRRSMPPESTEELLFNNADKALFEAKRQGRNRALWGGLPSPSIERPGGRGGPL